MKKTFFMPSLANRKGKCKFTRSCGLYSNASYTCTHTGGSYCGKYRKLTHKSSEDYEVQSNRALLEVPM